MGESRRLLLRGPGIVLAAGAHDALSAKLAEQAGFAAIWAGGFGISAVQAVPDANILTLTETLEAVRRIVDTVGIPVIADCDNGYGNAINVMRTAAEFERAGAAGICIEDNEFPKGCSFYAGVRRGLVPAEEPARKVEAATAARRDPGFLVIARTEALIAGLGQEEALRRARAYVEAGADAVLIHSKAHDFTELRAFAAAWDRPVPLVAVPTTYPTVGAAELAAAGFRMAIFANQALRAAIVAMRDALAEMRRTGTAASVEERIARLEEVYALVGVPELPANEQRILFAPAILVKLLQTKADAAVVVDRAFPDAYRAGLGLPAGPLDLVVTETPANGRRFVAPEGGSRVVRIGPEVAPEKAHGEFIGMAMFSAAGAAALRAVHQELAGRGTEGLERASVTHLLQALIDRGRPVVSVDIHKGWMEIDTIEDYRRACAEVTR